MIKYVSILKTRWIYNSTGWHHDCSGFSHYCQYLGILLTCKAYNQLLQPMTFTNKLSFRWKSHFPDKSSKMWLQMALLHAFPSQMSGCGLVVSDMITCVQITAMQKCTGSHGDGHGQHFPLALYFSFANVVI